MRRVAILLRHKIAVVGSGPSGFYTADTVLKLLPDCEVDVFEKLPVPFGLSRYGVAPDHPEVKNVENTFTRLFESAETKDRIRFHGNVEVGREVTVAKLLQHFHQVVIATGASDDRRVGIEGEDQFVHSARRFVAWYNSFPGANCPCDLEGVRNVAIIGNGNVAVDAARILLAPHDDLRGTDINMDAYSRLCESSVRSVELVARRGILNTAFTIKEFREMLHLGNPSKLPENPHLTTLIRNAEIATDIQSLDRRYRRLIELIRSQCEGSTKAPAGREFRVTYLRKPREATAKGLLTDVMRVVGPEVDGKVEPTGETEFIEADLVLRSVGYRSIPVDATVPFDDSRGVIPAQVTGRVVRNNSEVVKRLYCVGWVKNGPVGVIVAAHADGKTVGNALANDAGEAEVDGSTDGAGIESILPLLVNTTSWSTWESIRARELERGAELSKAAEKLANVSDMLAFRSA
ncbi:NADPH:adrenodoxin oxidoreductase [Diplonema papillatum]|nr:NADPH:adrenodoxin oxidoreductase [Diplonema papillatum]